MDSKSNIREMLHKQLKGATDSTIESLTDRLGGQSMERTWLMMDFGASLAAYSLRVSVEFLRAAPEVARFADNNDVRKWGEIGKRLAATSTEVATEFFQSSVAVLAPLTPTQRTHILDLCNKQSTLSAAIALESFKAAPGIIKALRSEQRADDILAIAYEIARHSVKHSSDLLKSAPAILDHLNKPGQDELVNRALELTAIFAHRSGGTATEFFTALPEILTSPQTTGYVRLFEHTIAFLERGGGVALQYFRAAGVVLNNADENAFERWTQLCESVAGQGNAASYHFLKASPKIVTELASHAGAGAAELINRVLGIVEEVGKQNSNAAVECFKASPQALKSATLPQFREWALRGLDLYTKNARQAQAYYSLESKNSQDTLQSVQGGLTLESIAQTLRLYVEGLTGREFTIAPLTAIPDEAKIGDGRTIHLPSAVAEFPTEAENFRLYKVLAAHAAGQVEFGTNISDTLELNAALMEVQSTFSTDPRRVARAIEEKLQEEQRKAREKKTATKASSGKKNGTNQSNGQPPPAPVNFGRVISEFPYPGLAMRIFATIENGRIDRRLRYAYRGIRRDLDFVRQRLRQRRPALAEVPPQSLLFELLFQIALCGGASDESRIHFGRIVTQLEEIVESYLNSPTASVADTALATLRIYEMLDKQPEENPANEAEGPDKQEFDGEGDNSMNDDAAGSESKEGTEADPLAFWALDQLVDESEEQKFSSVQLQVETPEQGLEPGDKVFYYDEWDRELGDYRTKWSRVIERRGARGSRQFVEKTRGHYSGVISSIRYQFQLLKLESLRRINNELDGEDFNLESVIQYVIDKRATGRVSERLYTRKLRRERDVAVSFLLDMSSSTARTVGRHPKQPYTKPGQRIIDIEKEGLVLMSEALEAVGDAYAMYGFSSEGRHNVKFYVIKEFGESYSAEIERRVGGISYQNNTRLGAAIRHTADHLKRESARTKLLIILSDGRPYDHDYGDTRYAREDTKMALRQARVNGITPFCITIEREGEEQLKDMYGEVGYTIIDNILSLPERLPGIYRRLTT